MLTDELIDHDITALSGGQRQRMWLAMTLAQDTPVLLLDEPATFLDPADAIGILELARVQARAGKADIMVLYDLMLAGQYSDRMIVVKDGEIIVSGTPQGTLTPEVLQRPMVLTSRYGKIRVDNRR